MYSGAHCAAREVWGAGAVLGAVQAGSLDAVEGLRGALRGLGYGEADGA
jgi:hypothetical protein